MSPCARLPAREVRALRRDETFYDDALDAVDKLRSAGAAGPDDTPDTVSTTEVTAVPEALMSERCYGSAEVAFFLRTTSLRSSL